MSSPPATCNNLKKPIRELSSITNHLLLTKTLNALNNNSNSTTNSSSTASFKENIPNEPSSAAQQKALNLRLAAALKPVDRDNVAALLQFYQTLGQTNSHSNGQNHSISENSTSVHHQSNSKFSVSANHSSVSKANSKKGTSMTYLCRFNQRNRLIEIPLTSEHYNHQNGVSHEYLKQLIMQEFHLQKTSLIIQIWNEQYQEYIDIESYKRLPADGRLQVMIEKPVNYNGNSPSVSSKSPTTPIALNSIVMNTHSATPNPLQSTPTELHQVDEDLSSKPTYEEPVSTISPMQTMENISHGVMYDLLPKPSDGIPIPRFPPHIAAFLNGNGDANQLNALVQALYQEIVKYELYPNADELRSIVSRLVDRHPNSLAVIGSIELLVRKLYYKFCNERKKYPVELKRRQPNKRKRLTRDEDSNQAQRSNPPINDLDRFMHLWANATGNGIQSDYRENPNNEGTNQNDHDSFVSPTRSPSNSSSNVSSPENKSKVSHQMASLKSEKISPLNLSMCINNGISSD